MGRALQPAPPLGGDEVAAMKLCYLGSHRAVAATLADTVNAVRADPENDATKDEDDTTGE